MKTTKTGYGYPLLLILSFLVTGCKKEASKQVEASKVNHLGNIITEKPKDIATPTAMAWIPGGTFTQGALETDKLALAHEKPAHPVTVDGFFMDITEVTNEAFTKFVDETGYVTVAEQPVNWHELKKSLPPGTPKPNDSLLAPGSLVFKKPKETLKNLDDYSQWWEWRMGANWKQPYGPGTDLKNKEKHPVVHIAYEDAVAYCKWANRRLPTEAEWEYASKMGLISSTHANIETEVHVHETGNIWNGDFPYINTKADGFEHTSPVKSFPPNSFGLFDLAGNVWEWTQDWYHTGYYQRALELGTLKNPIGASSSHNPSNPYGKEKVIKGGSFLCHISYCASFRPSARMGNTLDSSAGHLGFRTVADIRMLQRKR